MLYNSKQTHIIATSTTFPSLFPTFRAATSKHLPVSFLSVCKMFWLESRMKACLKTQSQGSFLLFIKDFSRGVAEKRATEKWSLLFYVCTKKYGAPASCLRRCCEKMIIDLSTMRGDERSSDSSHYSHLCNKINVFLLISVSTPATCFRMAGNAMRSQASQCPRRSLIASYCSFSGDTFPPLAGKNKKSCMRDP